MSSLKVRTYRQGDEKHLVALWNRAYAAYGGHVRRSESYWRWSILERPGIVAEDIVILEEFGKICGYGVLGPEGVVLEFAVAPDEQDTGRERLAVKLLEAIEDRWFEGDYYSLALKIPSNDESVLRAVHLQGYEPEPQGSGLQVVPIDLVALLQELLRKRIVRLSDRLAKKFRFVLTSGACRFLAHSELSVILDPLTVTPINSSEAPYDCSIEIELSTLADLIFRRSTYDQLLASGDISVQPATAESDASALLHAMVIEAPWFTPAADER